jgi:hypothetical protein
MLSKKGAIVDSKTLASFAGADAPEVVLYESMKFEDEEWRTNLSYSWVGDDWNDKISSIIVVRGLWEFFEHRDFQGQSWKLGPGYYNHVRDAGIPDDSISSFRSIG